MCFYYHTNAYYDVLGDKLKEFFRSVRESFFFKKTKTDVCGKISQEGIVRLRSGKKDSVPFSMYFKTDQVFKTGSVPL